MQGQIALDNMRHLDVTLDQDYDPVGPEATEEYMVRCLPNDPGQLSDRIRTQLFPQEPFRALEMSVEHVAIYQSEALSRLSAKKQTRYASGIKLVFKLQT